MTKGICHECCKPFDNKDAIELIANVWECPHCDYPNSKSDMGINGNCRLEGCDEPCPLNDIPYCCIQHMNKDIDHNEPPKKYGQC